MNETPEQQQLQRRINSIHAKCLNMITLVEAWESSEITRLRLEANTDVCGCGHDYASHDPDTVGGGPCEYLGVCAECLAVQP